MQYAYGPGSHVTLQPYNAHCSVDVECSVTSTNKKSIVLQLCIVQPCTRVGVSKLSLMSMTKHNTTHDSMLSLQDVVRGDQCATHLVASVGSCVELSP